MKSHSTIKAVWITIELCFVIQDSKESVFPHLGCRIPFYVLAVPILKCPIPGYPITESVH